MSFAGKANIGGSEHALASTLYGVCTTAGATAAKVVTCPDFDTLLVGVTIAVKFLYTNAAASPTLNVNGTGAIPIYTDGTNAPGTTPQDSWAANSIVSFTYDGNAWLMTDTMGTALASFKAMMLDAIYPIGSIYMSVNSANPSLLFGGSWEQIQDKFLLSAGSTYAAGASGGSATKNIQHNHGTQGHALSRTELPNYSFGFFPAIVPAAHGYWNNAGVIAAERYKDANQHLPPDGSITQTGNIAYGWEITSYGGNQSHSHGDTGYAGSTAQDIMPPYLAVYVWKRTA